MNNPKEQQVIRFRTDDPIEFDGMDAGPWKPDVGKDYICKVIKVGDQYRLNFQNPVNADGWEASELVGPERFYIVGNQEAVIMTKMGEGRSIAVSDNCKKFLEGEILSHLNMDPEDAAQYPCNLFFAQGNLRQMEPDMLAEILDVGDDGEEIYDIEEIYEKVDKELEEVIKIYGGDSFLTDLFRDS